MTRMAKMLAGVRSAEPPGGPVTVDAKIDALWTLVDALIEREARDPEVRRLREAARQILARPTSTG